MSFTKRVYAARKKIFLYGTECANVTLGCNWYNSTLGGMMYK